MKPGGYARMVMASGLLGLALAGCGWLSGSDDDAQAPAPPTAGLNQTDPRWVSQATPHKPVAVVFIHGIIGDTLGTWTVGPPPTKSFFDYLKASNVGEQVDVFAFGFTSEMLGDGSLDVNEAATKLEQQLDFHDVTDYDTVVFVAHSMGGLITMKMVSNRPDLASKVPLLVFYGTPQSGAEIARVADKVADKVTRGLVSNGALKTMYPADGDAYMRDLNEDWVRVRARPVRPTLVCAYEKSKTFGVMIVPWSTATRFCDEVASAIGGADHISIVKPDRPNHDSVVLLVNAINKHVLPRINADLWDMPDLRKEGDLLVYELTNVTAPNGTSLRNRSGLLQQVSASAVDPNWMLLLPEEPQYVAADGQGMLRMMPIRELQPEYRIRLKLGSAPERTVVARIADMTAAHDARAARDAAVVARLNAELETPEQRAAFEALSETEQQQRLSAAAESAIAAQAGDLPESARLLMTADTLASIGLSRPATFTLQETERRYPAVARTQSARHLAGVVAAQSGQTEVYRTIETPAVELQAVEKPANLQSIQVDQRNWTQLAERMQTVPTLKSDGLAMKGDVLRVQGDTVGAKSAYQKAAQLKPSPLLTAKQVQVERVEATPSP